MNLKWRTGAPGFHFWGGLAWHAALIQPLVPASRGHCVSLLWWLQWGRTLREGLRSRCSLGRQSLGQCRPADTCATPIPLIQTSQESEDLPSIPRPLLLATIWVLSCLSTAVTLKSHPPPMAGLSSGARPCSISGSTPAVVYHTCRFLSMDVPPRFCSHPAECRDALNPPQPCPTNSNLSIETSQGNPIVWEYQSDWSRKQLKSQGQVFACICAQICFHACKCAGMSVDEKTDRTVQATRRRCLSDRRE